MQATKSREWLLIAPGVEAFCEDAVKAAELAQDLLISERLTRGNRLLAVRIEQENQTIRLFQQPELDLLTAYSADAESYGDDLDADADGDDPHITDEGVQ